MASRLISDLHPVLANAYYLACKEYRAKYPEYPQPFITCTHRSNEEQEVLFKQIPPVTRARAGGSPHNYKPSFAFDIAFITVANKLTWDKIYFQKFADIIMALEVRIEWGGLWKFRDLPHFEIKNWKHEKNS